MKHMQYRAFLLVFGMAAGPLLCSAQLTNSFANPLSANARQIEPSISGRVVGNNGKPLHDIRIEVRSLSSAGLEQTSFSAMDGTFHFAHLPPGKYEVVSIDGVREARKQVFLRTDDANVDLRMNSGAGVSGPTSVSVAQLKTPEKAKRLMDKAREAFNKNRPNEVAKYLDAALAFAPDYADALTTRAILKMDARHDDSALEDLDHAIKADPGYAPAYLVLGALFNQRGRFDDALRSLDRGASIEPKSWQCAYELAKAWLGKHDYEHALQQLKRAEALGGARMLGAIHIMRGYALLGQRQFEQANHEFEAYLSSEPKGEMAGRIRAVLAEVKTQLVRRSDTVPLPAVSGLFAAAQ
jgi:tetratricopeptide (TPR) repeat protein